MININDKVNNDINRTKNNINIYNNNINISVLFRKKNTQTHGCQAKPTRHVIVCMHTSKNSCAQNARK